MSDPAHVPVKLVEVAVLVVLRYVSELRGDDLQTCPRPRLEMSAMIEQVGEALPIQGPVLIPRKEAGVVRVVIFKQVLVTKRSRLGP